MFEFKKWKLRSLKFYIQNKMEQLRQSTGCKGESKSLCKGLLQMGGYTRRLEYN